MQPDDLYNKYYRQYVNVLDNYRYQQVKWIVEDKVCKINPKKPKSIMTKVSNMMKKLLDADTQTLVKAGYINGDLELTEKGRYALTSILFSANKAELITMANEELAEEKK